MDCVGVNKLNLGRAEFKLPVLPPAEALHEEVKDDPSYSVKIREAIADGQMPRAYHEHPVTKKAATLGMLALPVALYMDGVAYSLVDQCSCDLDRQYDLESSSSAWS